jgi:hypothetical protein
MYVSGEAIENSPPVFIVAGSSHLVALGFAPVLSPHFVQVTIDQARY